VDRTGFSYQISFVLVLALVVFGTLGCEQTEADTSANKVADVEQLSVESKTKESGETDISHDVTSKYSAEASNLTVHVLELVHVGPNVLKLRFSFSNTSNSGEYIEFGNAFAQEDADVGTVAGVYLIDALRQKKYFILRASDGKALCSSGITRIGPGESLELWANFPAPPQDSSLVTVHVPMVPPIGEVPIT